MRATRRSVRTAAIATGAAAALLLPAAGAAFAADSGSDQAASGQAASGQAVSGQAVSDQAGGDQAATDQAGSDQSANDQTATDQSVFWRNVDLADGSLAKVYKDGPGRFSADIYGGGSLVDTLVSVDGKPAYGENNGLHVVLRPDGTVSSWLDKAPAPKPAPKPKPKPAPKKQTPRNTTKVVKLPDGHTATFFAGKDGRPYVKLSVPGGKSWTYNFHGTLVSQVR
ncbi:hypothetical protein [Streptomyces sp. NPDC002825]|uniref:hypothetical protein n=1 Tax=Streptomyces sp. NPDC002825 TaxID=3154666 RepID=UPI003330A7CB